MGSNELLMDAFERVRDGVHPAANGLTAEQLAFRPDAESNSIAWLVWHLTRIQDDHVAALAGAPQVWTAGGWADRFALPLDPSDTGYGHDAGTVAVVVAGSQLLLGYFEDVHAATVAHLRGADQRWLDGGWAERFDLPLDRTDTGYGHDPAQVGLVVVESHLLLDYFEDVHATTVAYLATVTDDGLERVVDASWDPPVTVRVRLISVIADDLQHVGQAAYVRGLVYRR